MNLAHPESLLFWNTIYKEIGKGARGIYQQCFGSC